jgi:hypothetical protein
MFTTVKNLLKRYILKKQRWSISFFITTDLINPDPTNILSTITTKDITDCKASFVADPFLIQSKDIIYCFFEIKSKDVKRGVIGYSSSNNYGKTWEYGGIILQDQQFHLSYPNIYYIDDNYYMIPEIGASSEIRLYIATDFPKKWKLKKILLKGKYWADPTIFYHNNAWYLFVSENTHKTLYLYCSDKFDGEYQYIKTIYKDNDKLSRPAGNIFTYNNKIYRIAQNCYQRYGNSINLLEINNLSQKDYQEDFIKILLKPDYNNICWNDDAIHHYSFLELDNQFLIATDGEGHKWRI